jgi:hypothetical protein
LIKKILLNFYIERKLPKQQFDNLAMKRLLVLGMLFFLSISMGLAQDEDEREINTLLGNVESSGGYGAFSLHYTSINDKTGFMMGGRGCWVVNHSLALGVGGKGFFTEYNYDPVLNEQVNLQGLYGGLLVEPILGGSEAIHFSFPLLIGGGRIAHAEEFTDRYYYEYNINDMDGFFVVEPGVELELNMLRFFRIAVGGYYRYTSALDLYDTDETALKGFNVGITFKFGVF